MGQRRVRGKDSRLWTATDLDRSGSRIYWREVLVGRYYQRTTDEGGAPLWVPGGI